MSKIKLMCALSVLTVAGVVGQLSCVQLNATDLAVCACEDASLTFTIEGETTVAANTVSGSATGCNRRCVFLVMRLASRCIEGKPWYVVCTTFYHVQVYYCVHC